MVPTEQGHEEVATGWTPAVSPDGRSLAFAYHPIEIGDVQGPGEEGFCAENGIAVLDLDTGDVRRFPFRSAPVAGTECPAGEPVPTPIDAGFSIAVW